MAQIHMTEAELARDLHETLARVQQGLEVVVEQGRQPVAVIRPPVPKARLLSECIARARERGSTVTLDEGFMKEVEEGIARHSHPWKPPAWE